MRPIYQFSLNSLQGQPIDFSALQNKVVLIVNTASKCGFTPQYEGLQKLHQQYHEQGLVIIGTPCNQFGGQEPGGATDIQDSCLINYGVDFLISEKIEVNGENAHPLFNYLTAELKGVLGKKVRWNFTKFLIGRDGTPIKRFAPTTKPESLVPFIEKALNA